jgi:type I site-specific restriction endonuclease
MKNQPPMVKPMAQETPEAKTRRELITPAIKRAGWDEAPHSFIEVEAKRKAKPADAGLQQARDYAEMLGVKFTYATNGSGTERKHRDVKAEVVFAWLTAY